MLFEVEHHNLTFIEAGSNKLILQLFNKLRQNSILGDESISSSFFLEEEGLETPSLDLALVGALDVDSFFSLSAVGGLLSEGSLSLETGLASITGAAVAFLEVVEVHPLPCPEVW